MALPRANDWLETEINGWTSGIDLVVSLLEREEVKSWILGWRSDVLTERRSPHAAEGNARPINRS